MMTPHGRAPHILIMDDTPEILDLLREVLEEERYRVTASQALLDAESITALAPDTIIQDLLFSSSADQSLASLKAARHDPQLSRIPRLLCTAATQVINDNALATTLNELDVQVVLKPFDLDALLGMLASTLQHVVPTDQSRCGEVCDPAAW